MLFSRTACGRKNLRLLCGFSDTKTGKSFFRGWIRIFIGILLRKHKKYYSIQPDNLQFHQFSQINYHQLLALCCMLSIHNMPKSQNEKQVIIFNMT